VRFRGGGHKQAYRKIDFKRRKFDVPATVERHRIRSEPHRLHRAGEVQDGELSYILAPQRLAVGDTSSRASMST
jgi:large subunit ribosomal protein L2